MFASLAPIWVAVFSILPPVGFQEASTSAGLKLAETIALENGPVQLAIDANLSLLLIDHKDGSQARVELDSLVPTTNTQEPAPSLKQRTKTRDGILEFSILEDGRTLRVYDHLSDRELTQVDLETHAGELALTDDDVSCLVPCPERGSILFINSASFEVTARLSEGLEPGIDEVLPFGTEDRALVANRVHGTLSLFDIRSRRVVSTIELGKPLDAMVVDDKRQRAFFAHSESKSLSVVTFPSTPQQPTQNQPNEVIVLGMIHRKHRTSDLYGLDTLKSLVRTIKPDVICTEIPPNRFEKAWTTFEATGVIDEPRVRIFPEYTDVVFPLALDMKFTIVPTAGWTAPMNDFRRAALNRIEGDPARANDWKAYQDAMQEMSQTIADLGRENDPRVLHTDDYDEAIELGFGVYNELFNDELGPGGWENINQAHYAPIHSFLDDHVGHGLRILVTYGSAHKGWMLRQLRKRTDITLLDPVSFFDQIETDR